MFESNVQRLLSQLGPEDVVLDVGGWACPFNRAQWVLDAEPYESRGFYRTFGGPPSQGGEVEWFTRDTWVRRDMCAREPWPFEDRFFDVVVCSHTLEDVRDPIWVCSEIVRVGKRGYIEVPSRAFESTWGVERKHQAGLSHHRWLVEIQGNEIRFLPKYAMIHSHRRYALPRSYRKSLTQERAVQWLWWEGAFSFREVTIHGLENQEAELLRFAREVAPAPGWRIGVERLGMVAAGAARTTARLLGGAARVLRGRTLHRPPVSKA